MNTAYSDTETEHTEDTVKERSDSESVSDASTIINNTLAKRAPTQASVMASQALTNVTALSKKSLNHMEPDSVLGASTAHGTLKGRAKMDAMNKSHRSGLYSTIGRNAKMPEEDEDEEEESKHERSRRSQKPDPYQSQHSLAKSAVSGRTGVSAKTGISAKTGMSAKTGYSARSGAAQSTKTGRSEGGGTNFSSSNQKSREPSRDRSAYSGKQSRNRSRSRSKMSEGYSKSNLSISETNLSETNLSMTESQYSRSQYSNSQYSNSQYSRSDRTRSDRSESRTRSEYSDDYSQSTIK